MLPQQLKLDSSEFRRVVRAGRRTGTKTVVVHLTVADQSEIVRFGGPHFGLIVSKAVGNSIIRHRTYRRLRHVCQQVVGTIPQGCDVVIRALPRAGQATSKELMDDVSYALAKLTRA
ncbi:ribonuclease P protein component [Corynebacterium sp. H128]|uniref:ribonuclease P protein component n=1 Tax=unclassified Corynebacterium TaxID=2624378 RepID=UPI0030ABB017